MTTIAVAIVAVGLISTGFFWMLFADLPEVARRAAEHRRQQRRRKFRPRNKPPKQRTLETGGLCTE